MIKRSFIGLFPPVLQYEELDITKTVDSIKTPESVIFFVDKEYSKKDSLLIQPGDKISAGDILSVFNDSEEVLVPSVTGEVTGIEAFSGNFGKNYTAVTVKTTSNGKVNKEFGKSFKKASGNSLNQIIKNFPGVVSETVLINSDKPVDSIVITGIDSDLLILNNQYIIKNRIEEVKAGISFIKKATGIDNFTIVVPESLASEAQSAGVSVKTVELTYPNASHMLITQNIMGRKVIAGKTTEDAGVKIINAETVAAIGAVSVKSGIPDSKLITVINKDGSTNLISATIGTPINTILSHLKIDVNERDRIITGGPLTGTAIYSDLHPVLPDTDAIMIQDREDIPEILDNSCINCGECVRICPANVPVNLLIRFLENGEYDEAADNYDLFSCIDCGLCAYVCQVKIPVFQYIKLAKHELTRNNTVEAENA